MPGAVTGGLSLRSVTLIRGRQAVVRSLDWDAPTGLVSRVDGENGSGKSTLLAAMAGRVAPASGSITLGSPSGGGAGGVVGYHPGMEPPPEVTLGDWLRLVSALVPPGAAPDLVPELPRGRRLGELSTGERKRAVLEALLRRRAGAYLLDEPFEHLSAEARGRLATRLDTLAEHAVVVVATHDPGGSAAPGRRGPLLRLLGNGRWRLEP